MGARAILKRVLSALLTVCLVLSPVAAPQAALFAAGQGADAAGLFADTAHDAAEELSAQWAELQGLIGQYYGEWGNNTDKIPESAWRAAYSEEVNDKIPNTALLGNGDIGVSAGGAYGGANNTKVSRLGKSDFWTTRGDQGSYPVTVGGVSIEAADVPNEVTPNLAFKKPVLVSSDFTDNGVHHGAANLTDGDDSTKWVGRSQNRIDVTGLGEGYERGGQWAVVDLGETKAIGAYALKNAGYNNENNHNMRAWKLQYLNGAAAPAEWTSEAVAAISESDWVDADTVTDNPNNDSGKLYEKDFEATVEARYVRLLVLIPSNERGNADARVHEIELFAPGKPVNIAPSGVASASSNHNDFPPARAIDGRELKGDGTDGYEGWVSVNAPSTQWFMISFPEAVDMAAFRLVHDGGSRGSGENGNNARKFRLETSSDDGEEKNWTTVWSTDNNAAGVTFENFAEPVSAKYLRVFFDLPQQSDSLGGNDRARIPQLEIYGTPVDVDGSGDPQPGGGAAEPANPEFYEKQDILNARVETSTTIAGIPLQITSWTPANANYIIQKLEVAESYPEETGRLRAVSFTPPGTQGGTMELASGVDEAAKTAWASRKTASPNQNYDNSIGWRSEAVLNTKTLGATDISVGVLQDGREARSFVDFTITKGVPAYVITAVGGAGRTYIYGDGAYDLLNPERNGETPVAETARMLAAISDESVIDGLLADHAEWWKNYWMQSYVKINEDGQLGSVEKYYYAAQYMLGASTREGKQPAGLYAHWHTNDNATWNGDYHLNYNFISTWYGSASSNREEQLLPAVSALNDYLPVAIANASRTERDGTAGIKNITNGNDANRPAYTPNEDTPYVQFRLEKDAADGVTTIHPTDGIKGGTLFPVGIGPWGSAPDSGFHGEAVNGPFSAWPMIEYYNYTQDLSFLENEAFDMLKGSANFGVNWMEKYGRDASGQNLYRLISGYNEGSWSLNPAVELGAYKMALENAARFGRILAENGKISAEDAAQIAIWEDVRAGMPKQPTAMSVGNDLTVMALCYALAQEEYKNGEWAEMTSPLPSDGNIIPLESIIPSGQIGYFSPEDELQTARNTILRFGGNAWSTINNFPKGFPVAARVKFNPQSLMTALTNQINRQMQAGNMRISDNAHGIEKTGAIEAVNSMLIVGDKGVVKVFPNWFNGAENYTNPNVGKHDAQFARLRAPGAFTVSATYDADAFSGAGGVTALKITSEAGAPLTLASPWGTQIAVKDANGEAVELTFGVAPNHSEEITVSFPTAAGMTYTFEPIGGESYTRAAAAEVTFDVAPDGAAVAIGSFNGSPLQEPIIVTDGDTVTLNVGLYGYSATADGYAAKQGYFNVSGADMTESVALSRSGGAMFNIVPQTSSVTVFKGDETVGVISGDGSLLLEDGVYTYTASMPGYNLGSGKFRVDEGRTAVIEGALEAYGTASFAVGFSPAPGGDAPPARIAVWDENGEFCEESAPGTYRIPDGVYSYRVSADGYADNTGSFTVNRTQEPDMTVFATLYAGEVNYTFAIRPEAAADAELKVYDAQSGEEVSAVDGAYAFVAGGSYLYSVTKEGYLDGSGRVDAQAPGEEVVDMRPLSAVLPITGRDMLGDARRTQDAGFNFDGNHINNIRNGDWIRYENRFILGGVKNFYIEYSTMTTTLGAVEVYLAPVGSQDISEGTRIIRLTGLPGNGRWGSPYNSGSTLDQGQQVEPHSGGFYDIYIRFSGDGNPHAMRFDLEENYQNSFELAFDVDPADAAFALTKAGESEALAPVSDADGVKTYFVEEGLYHYSAEKDGYTAVEATIFVDGAETVAVDLLRPAVEIAGFSAADGLVYNGLPQTGIVLGSPSFTQGGAGVAIADPVFSDRYTSLGGYDSETPPTDAGNYILVRTLVNDDYSGKIELPFVIEKREAVAGLGSFAASKTYDGSASGGGGSGQLTLDGALPADSSVKAIVTGIGNYSSANVGDGYEVRLGVAIVGDGSSNYRLASSELTAADAAITKRTPTAADFTVQRVLEDGAPKVGYALLSKYDGLGAATVTYEGILNTNYPKSSTPPTWAGTYRIVAEFAEGANFTATDAPIALDDLVIVSDAGSPDLPTLISVDAPERTNYGAPVEFTVSADNMKGVNLVEIEFTASGSALDGESAAIEGFGDFGLYDTLEWTALGDGAWKGKAIMGIMSGKSANGAADVAKITLGSDSYGEATVTITGVKVFGIDEKPGGGADSAPRDARLVKDAATTYVWNIYDVNRDGKVDNADLAYAFYYYRSEAGEENWDAASRADVIADGVIDTDDLSAIYANYTP